MSTVAFERLSVEFDGQQLEGLNFSSSARRIGLVGGWTPLFALLTGKARARNGRVTVSGLDARRAVTQGELGVADPACPLPTDMKLRDWLTLSLRLAGQSVSVASVNVERTLEQLGLQHLGRYALGALPVDAQYAARVASACCTQPNSLVLPPPPWSASSRQSDSTLLDRAALGARKPIESAEYADPAESNARQLLVHCDPTSQPELFLSCDIALVAEETGCTSLAPRELSQTGRPYQLIALDNGPALAAQLEEHGARVVTFRGALELWVTLPPGVGTDLLVRAALETNAPLARMTPLLMSGAAAP